MSRMTTTPAKIDLATALVRLSADETLPVIGRCPEKGCKHRIRLDVHAITEVPVGKGFDYEHPNHPETAAMTAWAGTAAWLRNTASDLHACPTHGYRVEWKGLKATHVGSVVCDDSCRKAVSATCRCSCGGSDHGTI